MTIAPVRFEHNESYKHKYAKKVLADWLREDAKNGSDYSGVGKINFRSNRPGPYYGVHEEYPLEESIVSGNTVYVWDEFDERDWGNGQDSVYRGQPPTIEELAQWGKKPICVLDIAVQHKGLIIYGFEVCHKNPVPDWKAEILNHLDVDVFEIDAEWIMRQTQRPQELKFSRCFGANAWRRYVG